LEEFDKNNGRLPDPPIIQYMWPNYAIAGDLNLLRTARETDREGAYQHIAEV
jgi:hypothetical protein